MKKVYGYKTGNRLDGTPSEELIAESEAAEPTGAVFACLVDGVWHYVPANDAERLGEAVLTVYVDD